MEQYLPIVIAAIIGGGVAAVFKLPGQVSRLMYIHTQRISAEREAHEAQMRLVESLKRELFANGGRSLRDRVDEAAEDSKAALKLGQEGIELGKEVRQAMFNHIEWHAREHGA